MNFSSLRTPIYYWILFLSAIVYLITAWNSHGAIDPDEHCAIIEFARLKMGLNTLADMTWEYEAQIRSTIQPVICYLIFKFLNAIHITDPYSMGFFLRLLTAALALYSIHRFIRCTEHFVTNKNSKIIYYLLSYLTWFTPYISVHFGSETWGGLFLLNSLTLYFDQKENDRNYFLIGFMLGISFLCRFQMALSIMGFVAWLLFVSKISFRNILVLIMGCFICLLLGAIIDSWFYGSLVFTPWNYFYIDLVKSKTDELTSVFEASPWYTYLTYLLILPGYFLGILLLLSFLILIITKPKHILLWCIIPFLVVHSLIPHKQERFIFPMIYLLPLLLMSAYEKLSEMANKYLLSALNYLFIIFFVTLNLAGLIFLTSRSGANGKIAMVKYIHDHYPNKPVNLIYCQFGDILDKHGNIIPYEEKKLHAREIKTLCDLSDSLIVTGAENILVIKKLHLQMQSCSTTIEANHFILKKQSMPEWVQWLNVNMYNGFDPMDVFELYRHE
jgi:phosphatidylinositol glycan class B